MIWKFFLHSSEHSTQLLTLLVGHSPPKSTHPCLFILSFYLFNQVTALSAHSISPSLALGLIASRCLYYCPIHHERIVADWAPLETEAAEKGGLRRTTIMNSGNFSKFERLKELLIKSYIVSSFKWRYKILWLG